MLMDSLEVDSSLMRSDSSSESESVSELDSVVSLVPDVVNFSVGVIAIGCFPLEVSVLFLPSQRIVLLPFSGLYIFKALGGCGVN